MAFNTGTISITTTATLIIASNTSQIKRMLQNKDVATVYIGSDNSVTTVNGFPIQPGETLNIGDFNGTIYGIVAAGTNDIYFTED